MLVTYSSDNAKIEGGPVKLVEMLYSTNIVAVVGKNERAVFTPRRLTLWDTNASCSRLDIAFNSNILMVKMNKKKYNSRFSSILLIAWLLS